MRLIDASGEAFLLNGIGNTFGGTNKVNSFLAPSDSIPALQFRKGTAPFGQIAGLESNSGMNFDATGGIWRWRSVLNSDSDTKMMLDSNGLSVSGSMIALGNASIGTATSDAVARLRVEKAHTTATAGEQYGAAMSTEYHVADTGTKQGVRHSLRSHHATGTQANLTGFYSWFYKTGAGTLTSLSLYAASASSIDAGTVGSLIGFEHRGGSTGGTGVITNQYAFYVGSLTGATNNWAFYNAGTAPSYLGGALTVVGILDVQAGIKVNGNLVVGVPLGGIIPWLKSLTGTPSLAGDYVECNGQNYTPADSTYPYWNSGSGITVPNLNASGGGAKRFLRGSTTSGSAGGGTPNHSHSASATTSSFSVAGGPTTLVTGVSTTGTTDAMPDYYEVVYAMRVK